jgi:uncharacterized membrane protein YfhO
MVIELGARRESLLVTVSEAFHPWWVARVDGQRAPVLRAQMAFMGIQAPPGARRIELRFEPPPHVRAADVLSTGSWLTLTIGGLGMLWGRRRTRGGERP